MKNKLVKFLIPLTLLPLIACGQTNGSSKTASAPAVSSAASAKPAGGNVVETVKAKLEKTYAGQNLKVVSVSETPLKGIYEVIVTGKQVIYTDASGDFAQADRFYGESSGYGHDYAYAYGRSGEKRRSSGSRSSSVPTVTQVAPNTQTT